MQNVILTEIGIFYKLFSCVSFEFFYTMNLRSGKINRKIESQYESNTILNLFVYTKYTVNNVAITSHYLNSEISNVFLCVVYMNFIRDLLLLYFSVLKKENSVCYMLFCNYINNSCLFLK